MKRGPSSVGFWQVAGTLVLACDVPDTPEGDRDAYAVLEALVPSMGWEQLARVLFVTVRAMVGVEPNLGLAFGVLADSHIESAKIADRQD